MKLYRSLYDVAWWVWQHGRWVVVAGGACWLLACQPPPPAVTLVVTEVVELTAGAEVVITRVITQTVPTPAPTPAPTIPPEPVTVTLDLGLLGSLPTLDPQRATDANSQDLIQNVYVGLTRLDFINHTIEPELAQRWEVTPDGLTWTFFLRQDVPWVRPILPPARGLEEATLPAGPAPIEVVRPVTAGDFVFALQRACAAGSQTPDVYILFVIEGCRRLFELNPTDPASLEPDLFGARALDNTTLEIRLTQPASYLLAITTLPLFRPIPAERVTDPEIAWQDPATFVSSGPFVLLPWNSDAAAGPDVIRLQRNPHWPIPFPGGNVEIINLLPLDNVEDAFGRWENKEIDLAPLPLRETERFLDNPLLRPPLVTTQEVFYLGFNLDSPVFAAPEVRQAFSAAIDRQLLIDELYLGEGAPMRHFTPPGVLHAPPLNEVGRGYSPDYAQLQLAASGFGSCRLLGEIRYLISSSDIALQQAEALRDMWVEKLGCAAEQFIIEQVQFGTLLANTQAEAGARRPDIWDLAWASFYPDSHNWLSDVLHCTWGENRPRRTCDEADRLLDQAAQTADPAGRAQLYRQVENLFFGENGTFPIAPLFVRGQYHVTQVWLQYVPSLFGGEQYNTYFIDQVVKDIERSQ